MRSSRSSTAPFAVALAAALLALPTGAGAAEPKAAISVTLLQGKAEVEHAGAKTALAVGSAVAEGDTVETFDGTRLELALKDGSKIRLAPKTKLVVTEGRFGADGQRNVSVSLMVGNVWAKVAKALGAKDTFEVGTRNAVAGVRGTAFAVQAAADLSAVVRVYAGTVGVKKPDAGKPSGVLPKGERKQIAGPDRIDKKQWEEIIASAMKQVKISAAGDIAPAEDFEDQGDDQQWAMWNKDRDGK